MNKERFQNWMIPFLQVQWVDARCPEMRTTLADMNDSDIATWHGNKLWFYESLQGLARLDAKLFEGDRVMLSREHRDQSFADSRIDQITLSGLWLLGTYEWLRTFKDRLKELKHPQKEIFIALCNKFGSVRIPLAKFEPQRGKKTEKLKGYSIARPGTSRSGTGWIIDKDIFISRLELANHLIRALNEYNPFPDAKDWSSPSSEKSLELIEFFCEEMLPSER